MKPLMLILAALSPLLIGCGSKVVVRDVKAYRLEALFFKKTIDEQQTALKARLKRSCCVEAVFNSADVSCAKDGEVYAVAHSRAQHHYDRMMFLAGFEKQDPGAAPEIKTAKILEAVCHD